MAVENLLHNEAVYAIAMERGSYRRACWIAIRAMRQYGRHGLWRTRLRGSLVRREPLSQKEDVDGNSYP